MLVSIVSNLCIHLNKRKNFFDVDIVVKNKSKCGLLGLYSYQQRVHAITHFPTFFSYCFCILCEFVKVFERRV